MHHGIQVPTPDIKERDVFSLILHEHFVGDKKGKVSKKIRGLLSLKLNRKLMKNRAKKRSHCLIAEISRHLLSREKVTRVSKEKHVKYIL